MTESKDIGKKDHKILMWSVYLAISIAMFVYSTLRQNAIERQVITSDQNAIHRTETAFALGISGLKQTAIILESDNKELRTQNILLIECIRKDNCHLFPDVTRVRQPTPYTPISQIYFNIQEQMIEKSKQGEN